MADYLEVENKQLRDANRRLQDRAAELSSLLEGALTALRGLQQVVPPRDWTSYAQIVLEQEAVRPHRLLLKPNVEISGCEAVRWIEGLERTCERINYATLEQTSS